MASIGMIYSYMGICRVSSRSFASIGDYMG